MESRLFNKFSSTNNIFIMYGRDCSIRKLRKYNGYAERNYELDEFDEYYEELIGQMLGESIMKKLDFDDIKIIKKISESKEIICNENYNIDIKNLPKYLINSLKNYQNIPYIDSYIIENENYKELENKLIYDINKYTINQKLECINELDIILSSDMVKNKIINKQLVKVFTNVKNNINLN